MQTKSVKNLFPGEPRAFLQSNARGLLVAAVVAIAAQFLSEHYGAPAMLMALLLGIAFNFLSEGGACKPGIDFASRTVLRFGVALLGVRISVATMRDLGVELITVVAVAVVLTIVFGVIGSRLLGRGYRFGMLTGGAVAICGASAAMAISAVLPKNENSERNLIFTVLAVTVLSTVAMIAYPILAAILQLSDQASGVFLGGTIHDVAQVVGAGFSVSPETGEIATLVKLIRVAMLAPVVLAVSVLARRLAPGAAAGGNRPLLLPLFVVGFLFLGALNSLNVVPDSLADTLSGVSRWALLVAISAVGMKTSLKDMSAVGAHAIVLTIAETLFIAALVMIGVLAFGS